MCEHLEFEASVQVTRFTSHEEFMGRLALDVTAYCVECEQPVVFEGMPEGMDSTKPTVSVDRREARLRAIIA